MSELKKRVEAILFASGKGVSETDLVDYTEARLKEVKKILEELQKEYEERDSSLTITDVETKWKLTVKGKYTTDIQKIVSETELPKPILKTLAVVAYKSPVLQSDIIHMRGQGAYDHIKVLVKQKLITKDEQGRSYILKITDKFYNYFDVEGDEDIKEIFEQLRAGYEKKLGELEVVNATVPGEHGTGNSNEMGATGDHMGNLEVIDVDPVTAKRSEEELQEEDDFLKRMDETISSASQRIEKHTLPERHTHPELEKEQQTLDDTTTSIDDVKKAMNEEREKEKEENLKKETSNLEEIEKFVSKQEEEEEENFL